MADPIVTVCIPTYNRASLLKGAIGSVLSQTFQDFKLLIVDNASEDETEAVVRSFDDSRIIYERNARNIGVRGNEDRCLTLATGRYITILPDDDLMMPENLEVKVKMLENHAQVGLVHSKYHVIDTAGNIIRYNTNWGHGLERESDAIERGLDVLKRNLLTYNDINLPTVVFRRACYERLGGFTDRLSLAEDWEYWMRIAVYYDVGFLASPLIKWRFHAFSQTSQYAQGEGGAVSDRAFREQLVAKRLILKNPLHADSLGDKLREQVWERVSMETIYRAQCMWKDGKKNSQTRMFMFETIRTVPELILYKNIWKVLTRSMLSKPIIRFLKRFLLSGAP
jgi:glycosyltransferase involved in cell wall biosynthesis